jgi:hypothetical protein
MKRKEYISGIPIRDHLDDVREFTQLAPKYIERWGRVDSIYNWIGSVIRLKRRHWTGDKPIPYGIVVEVGPTSWLAALWADNTSPKEHVATRDINCWWPPGIYNLKKDMLARRLTEEQLLHLLRGLDYSSLTRVS